MWRLIFNILTNRGVDWNRDPREGEFVKHLHPSLCGWFNVYPTRYMWDETTESLAEWPGWEEEETQATTAQQELEIRARYAAMLVAIAEPYGQAERETWKTQEEEARIWTPESDGVSGDIDLCPMIRAMAAARGITVALMVAKILKNAELFRAASGQILGMQQAELDLLYPERKEEV